MSRTWRKFKGWIYAIGVLLTLAVAVLDATGHLSHAEAWFYDQRAKRCQFFTPPPTDRLVHVDIDDAALDTIGRWPWPRATLAEIVDEIHLAGAEALALDITLSEPEDSKSLAIDHDAYLAAAFTRFGRVMVPVSFAFDVRAPASPAYTALLATLRRDLELPFDETGSASESEFLIARRQAMTDRLRDELASGKKSIDEIRQRILPNRERRAGAASLQREFATQLRQIQSSFESERFSIALPSGAHGVGSLLNASDDSTTLMLPSLAQSAWCSGFCDYLLLPDEPVIRSVPLWVNYRGRLYPQMDLALACAVQGIRLSDIRFERGQVILPRPAGGETVIPVHDVSTSAHGTVGTFIDIPWFGGAEWQKIYDFPAHQRVRQHVPITLVWGLADARKIFARNRPALLLAMGKLAKVADSAKKFLANPPDSGDVAALVASLDAVAKEATELAAPVLEVPEEKRTPDEWDFLDPITAVRDVMTEAQAFEKKRRELAFTLQNKAVLIGSTATSIDAWPTPQYNSCPGVVIHGEIFNALINGHFWRRAPFWTTALITLGLGSLTTLAVVRLAPFTALYVTLLLAAAYLVFNSIVLFDRYNWIVGLAGPLIAITLVWGSLTLTRLTVEAKERARITRRFQVYVDPSIVNYVIAHPEVTRLEGQVREMTVCFTDLVGFTTLTEQLRERAVKVLGRYITRMVPPIRRHRGLVHRFMGDGIMFSYGAPEANPNQCIDAVATILEMQIELEKFNDELEAEGLPRLGMRAGANTGDAVVGDSGAADAAEYACLGDTTNTAARLESANKAVGTRCLISARTVELMGDRYLTRPIGRLVVAGRKQWMMTHEPLAHAAEATEPQKRLAQMTADMVHAYIDGRFEDCIAAANQLQEAFGEPTLTTLYREWCDRHIAEPPLAFEGAIVLREK